MAFKTFQCPRGLKVTLEGFLESKCPFTKAPDFYDVYVEYVSEGICIEAVSFSEWLSSFRTREITQEELSYMLAVEIKRVTRSPMVCVKLSGRHGSLDLTTEYCIESSGLEESVV